MGAKADEGIPEWNVGKEACQVLEWCCMGRNTILTVG
jgi:hypothetical protein